MTNAFPKFVVIGLLMMAAAGLALAMKPNERMASLRGSVDLEALIPTEFGDWRIDPTIVPIQVSPEVQAQLDKIYDRTLARTYVNSDGVRIMLSVAYGGDQSRSLQVHRPEVCYAAQGFQIQDISKSTIGTKFGDIAAMHLVARSGPRIEPITYWVRIGDRVVRGNLEQGFARLAYGLTGKVPDGLLFRVSSISQETAEAHLIQTRFINALLEALPAEKRVDLVGLK